MSTIRSRDLSLLWVVSLDPRLYRKGGGSCKIWENGGNVVTSKVDKQDK